MLFFLLRLDALTASKRGPQARPLTAVIWIREDVLFTRRVDRFDVGHDGAADAEETVHHEVVVSGAQAPVSEAVDEEIDAGVQVRELGRVQVNGQRKRVGLVRQQNDDVRRPADAESNEDDEDHLDLPDRLDDRRLGAPRSQTTAAAIARLQNAHLGASDVHEDAPVADDDDGEGKEHADGDVKQRVVVRPRAVPETLLRLVVERVRRPAGVARHVERQADHPRRGDDGETGATGEEAAVGGVVADVDVAVDADGADAEQRHDAAGDAEAGQQRAQPLTTVVKQRRTDNRTCCVINSTTLRSRSRIIFINQSSALPFSERIICQGTWAVTAE